MKKGFTLIELLAVIIILAIVALISTPIILNVVDEARESANKSSIAMYADAVKLAVIDNYFENQSYPTIDITWVNNNVEYGGERIVCQEAYYTETEGVTLHRCTIGEAAFNYVDDMSVLAEDTVYCYTKGKVYTDCENTEYVAYYKAAQKGASSTPTNVVFNDDKGVNAPQLLDGMTPIKWDGTTEQTTIEDDIDWYDYSNEKWANAKTEDGSYWVWIPRYAYMIGSGYHTSVANSISIEFLKNDTIENVNETTIETTGYEAGVKDTSNNYFLHPAFQNDDTKYGFWVAKFEASGTSSNIAVKPNVPSLRNLEVEEQFNAVMAMKNNAIYGFNAVKTDTHMIKNMEWGAVAYLSHSGYGKGNNEVWINNSSTYTTGCAGSSASAAAYSGCQNAYDTAIGQNASTTGNITGVYDMAGGTSEYVVGYVNNNNSVLLNNAQNILDADEEYKSVYLVGTTDDGSHNYQANENIYGDAVYETSSSHGSNLSWNGDSSSMPSTSQPWFVRGQDYGHTTISGLFGFYLGSGYTYMKYYTFRPVVVKVQ